MSLKIERALESLAKLSKEDRQAVFEGIRETLAIHSQTTSLKVEDVKWGWWYPPDDGKGD